MSIRTRVHNAVERQLAVKRFTDWLYDIGPDPNAVTREFLLHSYEAYLRQRAALDIFAEEEKATNVVPFKR